MQISFVTKNKEKLAIATKALSNSGIELRQLSISCPEIQSDDNVDIAIESAKYASELIQNDVVKIDTGFYIEALNGFPGPYAEYVENKLDAQDILNMMQGKTNRKAYYKEALVYCEYDESNPKEPLVQAIFVTHTYGTISTELSGTEGYNFDKIFIPDGETKTMANFTQPERSEKYSHKNWKKLAEYLLNQKSTGDLT